MTEQFVECDAQTLLDQIGIHNVLAISGGRVTRRSTGVTLPVRYGYRVTVDLAAGDTYTIRRVHERNGEQTVKGESAGVYAEQVGEMAYRASCFRDAFGYEHGDPGPAYDVQYEMSHAERAVEVPSFPLATAHDGITPIRYTPTGFGRDVSGAVGADGLVYSDADPGL